MRIHFGAPFLDVDAVQNTEEVATALGKDPVEAETVGPGLDFASVGGAYRRQQRAVVEGGFGEVHRSEVLELPGMVVLAPEPGDEQRPLAPNALMGEVVNGVDARAGVQRLRPLDGVDEDGDERRLPVVRVDDVGDESKRLA